MLTCFITKNGLTGQNNGSLAAPSKVTMEFEISRIFQCLTLLAVLGFSEVRTKQDIVLAIKWRSTCRVIEIRSSVLTSLLSSRDFWAFCLAMLQGDCGKLQEGKDVGL